MGRAPVLGLGLVLLALASTSCFGRSVNDQSLTVIQPSAVLGASSRPVVGSGVAGDVLAPEVTYPLYLFEDAKPPVDVQKASKELVGVVSPHKNLHVFALSSTSDTAALIVLEVSFHARWGVLMIPAERQIIRAFANDPTLGTWLILLTDVDVRGGPDPIPLTAYRWTRPEVEQYKHCGIPVEKIDPCTLAFYEAARTVLVSSKMGIIGQ